MRAKAVARLVRTTIENWDRDRAPRHAAALAFYTAFSIAPLLVIAIALAGTLFDEETAQREVMGQIRALIGVEAAEAIRGILRNAHRSGAGIPAAIAGFVALVFGASGAFGQLQDSLNTIWGVPARSRKGIWRILHSRFMTFAAVVGLGFLLLVSLVVSASLEALGRGLSSVQTVAFMKAANVLVSFGGVMALFMMMFKVLPETRVRWKDLWLGAALTAALFTAGKYVIGVYLGNAAIGSSFGAASSFMLILLWIYYSSQIVLLGAEFTKAYSDLRHPAEDRRSKKGPREAAETKRGSRYSLSKGRRSRSKRSRASIKDSRGA